jgi:hypothetical protein
MLDALERAGKTVVGTFVGAALLHLTVGATGGHVTITGWHEAELAGLNAVASVVLSWASAGKAGTISPVSLVKSRDSQ